LVGSYGHGGNTYENVTIVNEGDSTYFNPVTGETVSYSTWAYDYTTRTYTLYDADGNVVAVIQYGDDKLTIQTPDESYDINYVVPDSSGGSGSGGTLDPGESGSGSSLLDKIKDGILGVLGSLIEGLFALIKTILEKLLTLAKDLISFVFGFLTDTVLGGIKNLFSAFGDSGGLFEGLKGEDGGFQLPESEGVAGAFAFISGVVGILPAEIRSVLIFGIGAIFLFAILRKAGD
ncbi:hypothetical protein, partial [Oscillibacter sp.]|uniref:hypothetical protein n=1 Tax=Oscillibacter sp. TaxID=1945593 RepID=UPI0026129F1F